MGMTIEQACKVLEMFLHKQCSLSRTEFAYSQNEIWDAVKMASDALEKQIPKKPFIDPVDCAEVCPNCRTTGIWEDYGAPNDHCADCGQAIDWSE